MPLNYDVASRAQALKLISLTNKFNFDSFHESHHDITSHKTEKILSTLDASGKTQMSSLQEI